jgi:hypothetical protein
VGFVISDVAIKEVKQKIWYSKLEKDILPPAKHIYRLSVAVFSRDGWVS